MSIKLKRDKSGLYQETNRQDDHLLELSEFLSDSFDVDLLINWVLKNIKTTFGFNEMVIFNENHDEIAICFIADIEDEEYTGLLINKENFVQILKTWKHLKEAQVPYIIIKKKQRNNHKKL